MNTYRVYYYRNVRTVCWKDVKANSPQDAIKKARCKYIISIKEV